MLKQQLLLLAGLLFLTTSQAQPLRYKEGVDYFKIEPTQPTYTPGKVEVVEVFSYACHACEQFEPLVKKWKERIPEEVSFSYMPAAFNPTWELFARGYYAAEILDLKNKTHQALYDYVHKERKPIRTLADLAKFYSAFGQTEDDIKKVMNSFGVETKLQRAKKRAIAYQISETPTLVINGKWRIQGGALKSQEEILKVADYLIKLETATMTKTDQAPTVKPTAKH